MKYKEGEIVKVASKPFHSVFGKDALWKIDHIKTSIPNRRPTLYVCYRIGDKCKTLFQFLEHELISVDND